MKEILLKITPQWIRTLWFSIKEYIFLRTQSDRAARFAKIYSGNLWRNSESLSGFGSTVTATENIRAEIESLMSTSEVKSLLDIPCGDFNWMQHVRFTGRYTGADIVEKLIEDNQRRFGDKTHVFLRLDLVTDKIPQTDMVFCRECLNHLSLAEGKAGLDNLALAADRFLVVTHYPEITHNADQPTSFRFRPLNLTKPPFFLREPDRLIADSPVGEGRYMAVWDYHIAPAIRVR